jgi:hypothetical protein
MEQFLQKRITAHHFEERYLDMFKNDETIWRGETFRILDKLFSDVDAFCDDPSLVTDPRFDINESQLREETRKALTKLQSLPSSELI